jgi:hypothetical protein
MHNNGLFLKKENLLENHSVCLTGNWSVAGYGLNDESDEIRMGDSFAPDFRPATHSDRVEMRVTLAAGRAVNLGNSRGRYNRSGVLFRHTCARHDDDPPIGFFLQSDNEFQAGFGRLTLTARQNPAKSQLDYLLHGDESIRRNVKSPFV